MKVDRLLEKQVKLQNKIQLLKQVQEKKEKQALQRKKFLIGDYFYGLYAKNGELEKLGHEMEGFLKNVKDRKLFGLQ